MQCKRFRCIPIKNGQGFALIFVTLATIPIALTSEIHLKMIRPWHFLLLLLTLASCKKQPSDCIECNDPAAKNYNPNASGDTTCCIYGKNKPDVKTKLADAIAESSGLVFANGRLWTHNDSGGANQLYAIDTTTGSILQTVVLNGATNVDWEDLAVSASHLYVGDIGNNQGSRQNLKFYRFPLSALQPGADTLRVGVETIAFTYADQTDFTPRERHNFDCEAFIFFDNQLYLFTKNWEDSRCHIYTVPAIPGNHQAQRVDSFDARGLVTGADMSPSGKEVVLVGYTRGLGVFMWVLTDFKGGRWLSGNRKLIKLGDASGLGQMEGIGYTSELSLYFSSEKIPLMPARLYRLSTNSYR